MHTALSVGLKSGYSSHSTPHKMLFFKDSSLALSANFFSAQRTSNYDPPKSSKYKKVKVSELRPPKLLVRSVETNSKLKAHP